MIVIVDSPPIVGSVRQSNGDARIDCRWDRWCDLSRSIGLRELWWTNGDTCNFQIWTRHACVILIELFSLERWCSLSRSIVVAVGECHKALTRHGWREKSLGKVWLSVTIFVLLFTLWFYPLKSIAKLICDIRVVFIVEIIRSKCAVMQIFVCRCRRETVVVVVGTFARIWRRRETIAGLSERWKWFFIADKVTRAACGYFEDVDVQATFIIPRQ